MHGRALDDAALAALAARHGVPYDHPQRAFLAALGVVPRPSPAAALDALDALVARVRAEVAAATADAGAAAESDVGVAATGLPVVRFWAAGRGGGGGGGDGDRDVAGELVVVVPAAYAETGAGVTFGVRGGGRALARKLTDWARARGHMVGVREVLDRWAAVVADARAP
jgi:hypothetical protein